MVKGPFVRVMHTVCRIVDTELTCPDRALMISKNPARSPFIIALHDPSEEKGAHSCLESRENSRWTVRDGCTPSLRHGNETGVEAYVSF